MTFPFDPNLTQTGIWSEKRRKIENAACRRIFRQAVCAFLVHFPLSNACHEAADFLCGFFFMPAVTCVYTSSENSAEA